MFILCGTKNVYFGIEKMLKSYSYQFITSNKRFNLRANISQCKTRFYTQLTILLKSLQLHVHLRRNAMAI